MPSITNKEIYDALNDLRKELDCRISKVESQVDVNSGFRNNLEGKIAMGVITIGAFVSIVTSIATTFINDKLMN